MNRAVSSTCSISQAYEKSQTTTFSMSEEFTSSSEYMWGSESTIASGGESSVETSNEFAFGFEEHADVHAEVGVSAKIFGIGMEASAGFELGFSANQQWTESETVGSSQWSESSNSQSSGESQGSASSSASESGWECTETTTVECSAEMEVPPGHSVGYQLIFNGYNTTLVTYTDLKLTLCSALIDGVGKEGDPSEEDYIYVNDVPGTIYRQSTVACEVEFYPAVPLDNMVACYEAEMMAVASGSTHVPRCQSDNSTLYNACQCDIGDSRTMGACWCADKFGNQLPGKLHQFDKEHWADVCIDKLACGDTEVTR